MISITISANGATHRDSFFEMEQASKLFRSELISHLGSSTVTYF